MFGLGNLSADTASRRHSGRKERARFCVDSKKPSGLRE
jgi:hypothetical protein